MVDHATATRWFTTNRGLAVAIVSAGNGIGILAIAPLARYLISAYGSPTAFVVIGVLAWAIILPAGLLVRNSPAEWGYQAYGAGNRPGVGLPQRADTHDDAGMLAREGGASGRVAPTLCVITITHFLCCAAHAGPIFHMVPYAMDAGIPKMLAATMLGISGFISIAGRVGTGVIADHIGAKTTLVAALSLQAAGIALFLTAQAFWTFMVLAVVFGIAYGGVMPLYTFLTRQYFGERVMGTMYGVVFGISCVGMGIGSYLGGFIFDLTRQYAWLYVVSSLLGTSAIVVAVGLRPPHMGASQPTAVRLVQGGVHV